MNPGGLAVVIPALNEALTIEPVIRRAMGISSFVVVVDDGSTDGTGRVAEEAGAHILRNDKSLGYDAAISAGLNQAFSLGAIAVATLDADGQHRVEDLERVAAPVLAGEVLLCGGIRDHYNRPIERIIGFFSRFLFGTADPFCGLKCYGRTLFESFGPFTSELNIGTLPLVWVKRAGLPQCFVSIQVAPRIDHPRFGKMLNASAKLIWAFIKTLMAYAFSSNSSRRA